MPKSEFIWHSFRAACRQKAHKAHYTGHRSKAPQCRPHQSSQFERGGVASSVQLSGLSSYTKVTINLLRKLKSPSLSLPLA